jgi:hypothetical protein
MQRTRRTPELLPLQWAAVATALAATMTFLTTPANAGPKGMITVRPLGTTKITIDGSLSDWPLDKFTAVAQQPVFPMAQTMASTTAMGDHLVFDKTRVGLFNGTPTDGTAFADFGASMYFAYDPNFLYIVGVVIKGSPLRDDLDTTAEGSTGYLNDGFEFFLDPKGDSKGCIANATAADIDTDPPYSDDFQVTAALNSTFLPKGAAANVLGARQALAREGNPDLIGPGAGQAGGIYQDALTAIGGPDIAAQKYDDLRAAGAQNPEILANPNTKYAGYVIEMREPFSAKIPGLSPDHPMGFDLFWREVDSDAVISWADWGQSTQVTCNGGDSTTLMQALFDADNWGTLVFDKADALGQ